MKVRALLYFVVILDVVMWLFVNLFYAANYIILFGFIIKFSLPGDIGISKQLETKKIYVLFILIPSYTSASRLMWGHRHNNFVTLLHSSSVKCRQDIHFVRIVFHSERCSFVWKTQSFLQPLRQLQTVRKVLRCEKRKDLCINVVMTLKHQRNSNPSNDIYWKNKSKLFLTHTF